MNRKVLMLVLIAALALIGTGYAFWADQLTISNTVTTGELNVEFIDELGSPYIYSWDPDFEPYLTLDKSHGNKVTTFTIGNMFPGAMVTYQADIQNMGTIPAVIKGIDISFTDDSSELLKENLLVTGVALFEDGSEIKIGSFDNPVKLGDIKNELNTKLTDIEIEVNEVVMLDIDFQLPGIVDNNLEKQTAVFDVVFNFGQHNEP